MKTSLTIHDNPNLEKQMGGCMSSFFNLFEFSTNKRSNPKRLPPPVITISPDDTELSIKQQQQKEHSLVEQDKNKTSVTGSPWKFNKETPRLSLDSRAITDSKGGLRPREIRVNKSESNFGDDEERSSPSLIARLMGLEPLLLPSSTDSKKVELRKSASESRSQDYRFADNSSYLSPLTRTGERKPDNNNNSAKNKKNNPKTNSNNNVRRLTDDYFPQPVTIFGEIERRLRIKGIDEQSKDLETLKHILEALQLKGLLHSNVNSNVVLKESPVVLVKPVKSNSPVNSSKNSNNSSGEVSRSPRRDRLAARSPVRVDNRSLSPNVRRKGGAVDSPVQSPRNRSPCYNRKPAVTVLTDDDVSTVSSRSGYDSWRMEEYRDGRNLLKRCDKLLNSIAEITASSSSSELQQPSPVSVLDSSFYREDESSPSPVKKRTIVDFKEREDESWSPSSSSAQLLKLHNDIDFSDDSEFGYISEIIRPSNYFPYDDDLFLLLEKQSCINRDNSKASILQRKLIFDTIIEILNHNRRVPPWKAASNPRKRSILDQTRSEFQKTQELAPKIQEPAPSEDDLLEVVRRVLQKDMTRDSNTDWWDFPTEMSSVVLDIERLVFKDLIGEIIRDLATYGRKDVGVTAFRRKLIF